MSACVAALRSRETESQCGTCRRGPVKRTNMPSTRMQRLSISPSLSPKDAIPLIRRQAERLEQTVINLTFNHPDEAAWVSTTTNILNQAFGQPNGEMHSNTREFVYASSGLPAQRARYGTLPDPRGIQKRYVLKQQKRLALLKAYVEQLDDL